MHDPFRQELILSLPFICLFFFLIINHVRGPARMVFLTDEQYPDRRCGLRASPRQSVAVQRLFAEANVDSTACARLVWAMTPGLEDVIFRTDSEQATKTLVALRPWEPLRKRTRQFKDLSEL